MQRRLAIVASGIATLVLVGLGLTGCAGYTVKPHPGDHDEGLRFYRPEPYLLVTLKCTESATATSKSTTSEPTVTVVWLPAWDDEFAISTWSFLSKAEFAFVLGDGWRLTSVTAKTDTTDALAKFLELVGKGTEAGAFFKKPVEPAFAGANAQPQELRDVVKLFRIRIEEGGVSLAEVPMTTLPPGAPVPPLPK